MPPAPSSPGHSSARAWLELTGDIVEGKNVLFVVGNGVKVSQLGLSALASIMRDAVNTRVIFDAGCELRIGGVMEQVQDRCCTSSPDSSWLSWSDRYVFVAAVIGEKGLAKSLLGAALTGNKPLYELGRVCSPTAAPASGDAPGTLDAESAVMLRVAAECGGLRCIDGQVNELLTLLAYCSHSSRLVQKQIDSSSWLTDLSQPTQDDEEGVWDKFSPAEPAAGGRGSVRAEDTSVLEGTTLSQMLAAMEKAAEDTRRRSKVHPKRRVAEEIHNIPKPKPKASKRKAMQVAPPRSESKKQAATSQAKPVVVHNDSAAEAAALLLLMGSFQGRK
jgi:hypothetical protein